VLVWVEIQGATRQMRRGHQPGRATPAPSLCTGPLQQPSELRAEDAVDGAEQVSGSRRSYFARSFAFAGTTSGAHAVWVAVSTNGHAWRLACQRAQA
jgi:hypothetical protein